METGLNQRRSCAPLAVLVEPLSPAIGPRMSATSFPLGDAVAVSSTSLGQELANIYLHARYYDSQLGMFLSPDPSCVLAPGVGLNRYSYSMGDPVNSLGRSGLLCTVVLPDGTSFTANECVNVDADYPDDGLSNGAWSSSFWNYFFLGNSPTPPRRARHYFERPVVTPDPPVVTPEPPGVPPDPPADPPANPRFEETVDVVANAPGLNGIRQVQMFNTYAIMSNVKDLLYESKFRHVKDTDKAYHCYANCLATQQNGDIGEATSLVLGHAREILQFPGDVWRFGWSWSVNERDGDLRANAWGRDLGRRAGANCAKECGIR